jgi:hypothetical protein
MRAALLFSFLFLFRTLNMQVNERAAALREGRQHH